ncbi:DUF6528 family protein [Parapedobacter koreensis]|uniref:Uncharacterized protein n=1 Tax=Parapedobacter koreensis TaxID=332977 RepID=A0A1H7FM15_9SPHI|nr:DUF6528 family protein [Parapedobacter koreensis]SEK27143.1 hypothetical protein SAMN05421740_101402 [Parapedobacter koreensis]
MEKIRFIIFFVGLLSHSSLTAGNFLNMGSYRGDDFVLHAGDIVACGDDQVIILSGDAAGKNAVEYRWSWRASESKDQLPAAYQPLLATLDDCKPVDNNTKLLITSSSGATVLLDIASKKVLFYAKTPMAHSADLLPNNRIAVANSTHALGNSLEIYEVGKNEQVIYKDSLYSGHGVVWDASSKQLLALGFNDLRVYELVDWSSEKPTLRLVKSHKLPNEGGHDLSKVDESRFLVTTHHGVWLFNNTGEGLFEPFAPLADRVNVKSAYYQSDTGKLVFTIAEQSWWTFNIYGENPMFTLHIPSVKLYKVRVAP